MMGWWCVALLLGVWFLYNIPNTMCFLEDIYSLWVRKRRWKKIYKSEAFKETWLKLGKEMDVAVIKAALEEKDD